MFVYIFMEIPKKGGFYSEIKSPFLAIFTTDFSKKAPPKKLFLNQNSRDTTNLIRFEMFILVL